MDVREIIKDRATAYGIDPNAMIAIAQIESELNPSAKNPRSSAGGLFQQIDSNAKQYKVKDRFNPYQSADGAARFARDNTSYLKKQLGRDLTPGELYLAHQQGAGGALKILKNPNARAVDVVGKKQVELNGGNADMTAGEFAKLWTSKIDKRLGRVSGGSGQDAISGGQNSDDLTGGFSRQQLIQEAIKRGLIQDEPKFSREELIAEAKRRGLQVPTDSPEAIQQQPIAPIAPQSPVVAGPQLQQAEIQPLSQAITKPMVKDGMIHYPDGTTAPHDGSTLGVGPTRLEQFGDNVAAGINKFSESLSFGVIGDEANAGFDALIRRGSDAETLSGRYKENLDKYRGLEKTFEAQHPGLATATELAPMLIPGKAAANFVAKGATGVEKAARSGSVGAVAGGVHGFAEGEGGFEKRSQSAAVTGTAGAVLGIAAPKIGDYAGGILKRRADKKAGAKLDKELAKAAPSITQLQAKSSALFKKVEKSGYKVSGNNLSNLRVGVADDLADGGFHPKLNPTIKALADDLNNIDKGASLTELLVLRKQLGGIAGNPSPDNRHSSMLASRMIERIDGAVGKLDGGETKKAQKLWGQMRRAGIIEEAIEKAGRQASGFENGIRIQFRQILNSKNKLRGFSESEIEAMQKVVDGGPAKNALRMIGKFGFRLDGNPNALMGGLSTVGGVGTMGPAGVAIPMIGTASQVYAKKIAEKDAQKVLNRVLSGMDHKRAKAPQVNPPFLAGVPVADEVLQ